MTERQRFRESAFVVMRAEWVVKVSRAGEDAAWLWVEGLCSWNAAHDWAVQRINDRRLALPTHLVITDAIEEAQEAASDLLRMLVVPPEVAAKKEAEKRGIYTGPKRGRPRKVDD